MKWLEKANWMKRMELFNATGPLTQQVNMTLAQTVLPFKLAATGETLTAHAGLALFGEYLGANALKQRGAFDSVADARFHSQQRRRGRFSAARWKKQPARIAPRE